MKIKFPIRVIILGNNTTFATYDSLEAFKKGGMPRTPTRIEDARGKQVFIQQLYQP